MPWKRRYSNTRAAAKNGAVVCFILAGMLLLYMASYEAFTNHYYREGAEHQIWKWRYERMKQEQELQRFNQELEKFIHPWRLREDPSFRRDPWDIPEDHRPGVGEV